MSLRTLLEKCGYARKDLKRICGVSDPTAQRWLSEVSNANLMALRLIALHRQCTPLQIESAFKLADQEAGKLTPLEIRARQDVVDEEDWQSVLHHREEVRQFIEDVVERFIHERA